MRRVAVLIATLTIAVSLAACTGGGTTSPAAAPSPRTPTSPTSAAIVRHSAPPSCPARVPVDVPHHRRAGTDRALVPASPTGLLACRYHGFNQAQPIGTFARSATLPAASIAREINATPRTPAGAVFNCPMDAREVFALYFSYADGPPLLVRIDHGGCSYVTNGDLNEAFVPIAVTLQLVTALGADPI